MALSCRETRRVLLFTASQDRDASCATGFSFFPSTLIPFCLFLSWSLLPPLYTPLLLFLFFFSLGSGSFSAQALTSGFESRPAWFSAGMESLYFSMASLPLCFQTAVGYYALCLRAGVLFATLIVLNPHFRRRGRRGNLTIIPNE